MIPEGNYTYYDYDANGNRTAVRDPRSASATDDTYKISYTYDDNDRLTRIDYPDSTYETTVYDAVGNVTSKTDRKGQTTAYTFNNANRLTTITHPDETTTEYTYDAAGRILSVTQPDGSATYTKNLGNVTREFKLDSEQNLVYDYYTQYDDNGRMVKFIDASNATQATLPAVFNKVKYNENFNKLGYASNAVLGQTFKYGEEGASNRKYRQQEDQDDRVAKFGTILFGTDPIKYAEEAGPGAVLSTKYNYDDDDSEDGSGTGTGVLKSITDPFGKDYSFQRLENGSRTLYPNNTFTDRTYDQWGRLETIAHKRKKPSDGSETLLQSFTYQYDNSGNITKITEANGEYTEYYYDSNLTPRYCGTVEDIKSIWGVSSNDVFVAGNNGTILHYNGTLWSPMSSGTAENLWGIWGASSSDIFVVGENGAILHYNGSLWSPMTSGTTENLESIWGASGSNVYTVGTNGTILHYDGSSWSPMYSGTGYNLHSIWGVSANLIFVVGYYGKILQCYNSVNWYPMNSGTTQELRAVWGASGTDVYAVRDGEDILHYDGATWKTEASPVSEYLKALSGFSADNIFAAGNNGSLIHFDGSAWQQVISNFDSDIQAMHMFSATEMFMSGREGIVWQFTGNANNCGSLNRLAMERRRTSEGNVIYCIEYLFDDNSSKNGNIHKVVYDGKHVTEFTYNEMNELTGITHPDTSTETLTYDNNSNLTQTVNNTTGETTTYEWDCFDRLTKVTLPPKYGGDAGEEIGFTYNGEDELIKITYPDMTIEMKESKGDFVRKTAKFRFNGQQTSSDVEMSSFDIYIMGQLLCKYSSGPDAASTSRNSGRNTGEPSYYHYDHNNNLALITDSYGNIVENPLMDAYGNVLPLSDSYGNSPSTNLNGNLLTGGKGVSYLNRVKLYNMKRRFYLRSLKRFISKDPISAENNPFIYAKSNPIQYFDSTGLSSSPYLNDRSFNIFDGYKNDIIKFMKEVFIQARPYIKSDRCKDAFNTYGRIPGGGNYLYKKWTGLMISFLFGDVEELYRSSEYVTLRGIAYAPVEYGEFNKVVLDFDYISSTYGGPGYRTSFNQEEIKTAINFLIHELAHTLKVPGRYSINQNGKIMYKELYHFCCDLIAWECLGMKPTDRTIMNKAMYKNTINWIEQVVGLDYILGTINPAFYGGFIWNWNNLVKPDINRQIESPNLLDRLRFYGMNLDENQIGPLSLRQGKICCKELKNIKKDW